MSPTRLAFLVYEIDRRAGMQSQAAQLLPRLAAAGLDVRIVSTAAPRELRALRERPAPGAPELPLIRLPVTRPGAFEALARTWLASQGGVDVLLGLGWHEAVHAARIARRTRLPFLARYACSGDHGDMAALAQRPRELALLQGAARHVCISDEILREVRAAGFGEERLLSIPNGVDLRAWAGDPPPAALPFEPKAEVVLFLGRLAPQKRLDVLLRAVARLAPARPLLRLAVCGEGPLREDLEALCRELGIAERVAFLGVRDDVLALHRAARVFVLPSEGEGLPNALLEALAAGTPTLATAVAGTVDVVRHEREGLLVAPNDPEALAAGLERLLGDAELRARLSAQGRARVAEAYDVDLAARRYAEAIEAVAAERPTERQGAPEFAGRAAQGVRQGLRRLGRGWAR